MIINLPATVEMSTPNTYADQIEWISTTIAHRDAVIVSIHPHNDRGCAVAAAELGLMAGAERVEGTLFGNGERTGNVDLVTLGLNLASQGIDPGLDFCNINGIIEMSERCTKIPVHMRHPYAGKLVYTAFSGSHQDAINKGMKEYRKSSQQIWEVPYLPIDPADVGRTYESIIRINSQSGKGGIAYVMEQEFGYILPKGMHPEFGSVVQVISDIRGIEIGPDAVKEAFEQEYIFAQGQIVMQNWHVTAIEGSSAVSAVSVEINYLKDNNTQIATGIGNGPVDAFTHALTQGGIDFRFVNYAEHALSEGSDSKAVAYVEIAHGNITRWGVGVDENIDAASFKAIISGLNRAMKEVASIPE
jgi:2-isopropylmalate synthase